MLVRFVHVVRKRVPTNWCPLPASASASEGCVVWDLGCLLLPDGPLPTFPNLQFSALGYDIVRGNPLATMSDPGWQAPIFAFTYSSRPEFGTVF